MKNKDYYYDRFTSYNDEIYFSREVDMTPYNFYMQRMISDLIQQMNQERMKKYDLKGKKKEIDKLLNLSIKVSKIKIDKETLNGKLYDFFNYDKRLVKYIRVDFHNRFKVEFLGDFTSVYNWLRTLYFLQKAQIVFNYEMREDYYNSIKFFITNSVVFSEVEREGYNSNDTSVILGVNPDLIIRTERENKGYAKGLVSNETEEYEEALKVLKISDIESELDAIIRIAQESRDYMINNFTGKRLSKEVSESLKDIYEDRKRFLDEFYTYEEYHYGSFSDGFTPPESVKNKLKFLDMFSNQLRH